MEFVDESGHSRDEDVESEEETLSFCDLPVSGNMQIKNSSIEFADREDFDFNADFDFSFGGALSTEFPGCPADDLFSDGHILPLTESNVHCSSSKSSSFRENRIEVQAWRSDSLESRSSYWTSSSSNNSSAHRTNSRRLNVQLSSSTSPKSPRRRTKKSVKWQQFFAVGLSKTPVMQLEDMRVRQQKSLKNRHVEKPVNREKGETGRAKRWINLGKFTSFNGCMGSVKSVINCTTVTYRINEVQ